MCRVLPRLLDDLGRGVDHTESRLGGAMKKMQKFIRQTEGELHFPVRCIYANYPNVVLELTERGSGWCISILIVILIILLVAVVLF